MDLSKVIGNPVIKMVLVEAKPDTALRGKLSPIGKEGEEIEIDEIISALEKMIVQLERLKSE